MSDEKTVATEQPEKVDPESVVLQHKFTEVMYESEPQPLHLNHCVQKVFTSKFYGQFTIYDQSGRELGVSKNSTICFNKSKLQTEAANVWYEALAGYSEEYKGLERKGVNDIGLNFSHLENVTIRFHEAPSGTEEPNRTYYHIPVYYTVHNIWNSEKKVLCYS